MKDKIKLIVLAMIVIILLFSGCSDSDPVRGDENYNLSGQVKTKTGQGISDVILKLKGEHGSSKIKTDETGKWRKNNLQGQVKINVIKDGYDFVPKEKIVQESQTNVDFIKKEKSSSIQLYKMAAKIDPVQVKINGRLLDFPTGQTPLIKNSRTILPMSFIYQQLGFEVDWDAKVRKVTAQRGDEKIELWIGKKRAVVNGEEVELDVAPTIINARTYIPIYVAQKTKSLEVNWDGNTRTVQLHDWSQLDYGLYWHSRDGQQQKFVKGQENQYFDPDQPTVIFVHGWARGSTTDKSLVTFNYQQNDPKYGPDVNVARSWLESGWNVGSFNWKQFSDEHVVNHAEAKIWSIDGPQGMRWRSFDGSYHQGPKKSAARLFYEEYKKCLADYSGDKIRIVGHSLGNQMAVRLTQLIVDNIQRGKITSRLKPNRVALLDPYWSVGEKDYLDGDWVGERVRNSVRQAIDYHGILFEQYKSTPLADLGGDINSGLEDMTAFIRLKPWYISAEDVSQKHTMALMWYFWSYGTAPPPEVKIEGVNKDREVTGRVAASASTSNQRMMEMMGNEFEWDQVEGRYTPTPEDDEFEVKEK